MMPSTTNTLAVLAAAALATGVSAQRFSIEHFAQAGTSWHAALHHEVSTQRVCVGGIGEAFGDDRPTHEWLLHWLRSVDAVALAASDVAFAHALGGATLPFVGTNVRTADGEPVGRPFVLLHGGGRQVAVLAVTTRPVPAPFVAQEPAAALREALATLPAEAGAALVCVEGERDAAAALLRDVPGLAGAITFGGRRVDPRLLRLGERFVAQSPLGGGALARLDCRWDDTKLVVDRQTFAVAHLDDSGQRLQAELRRQLLPPDVDADGTARGIEGHGLDAASIDAAIDRGAAFLAAELRADAAARQPLGAQAEQLLVALALVHAGWHRRDAELDRAVRTCLRSRLVHTLGAYDGGVFCMLADAYDRPECFGALRAAARFLVEGQSSDGSWPYYPAVDPALVNDPDRRVLQVTGGTPLGGEPTAEPARWTRVSPWRPQPGGDNSTTQFALLGLRAAERRGVPVPEATWSRAREWYRRGLRLAGGFGYSERGSDCYGSMTLAGVAGLAVTTTLLGGDPRDERGVRTGLAWLRGRFAVDTNPECGSHAFYWLYSLERTGRILDRQFLGGEEWYPAGCRHLLATQLANGSWNGERTSEQPRVATSFALLFLTRATARLREETKRGGSGLLRTAVQPPADTRLHLVLDASGSMLASVGGGTKFDLARRALLDLLRVLPSDLQVGLRVYGHRRTAVDDDADTDTELVLPLAKLDAAKLEATLRALRARGKTPLARSLAECAQDLRGHTGAGRTIVVLLTDGGDDTAGRQNPAKAAAALAELPGVRVHVVGFDIRRDDWKQQLLAIAKHGGGEYFAAAGDDLARELRAVVLRAPDTFAVHRADGSVAATAAFGSEVSLPEGRYRVTTTFGEREYAVELWVNTDATTSVVFDGECARAVAPDALPAARCTGCAHELPANGRFCAHCGARRGGQGR